MYMKALFVGLVVLVSGTVSGEGTLDLWVQENLAREEGLLCKGEAGGDFFLVARVADGLKSGYRIDVTSESGIPRTFVIGWRFQDEAERPLGRATEPKVISSGYTRSGDRVYAEEFVIRDIPIDSVEKVRVIVSLSKYRKSTEAPRSGGAPDLEKVLDCVSRISPRRLM
ncbi:hypothetical protein HUS23_14230 [Ectothiorhodospiraceae bacterium 2226]|nr:hypothetical protein HUS23_14230 [Ectothiorhodospiraceae bacterium 2226]